MAVIKSLHRTEKTSLRRACKRLIKVDQNCELIIIWDGKEKELAFLKRVRLTQKFEDACKAGMSNWRPAGRMRPHCFVNAARCDLFKINCHLKL